MCRIVFFRGKITGSGRGGRYATIYVYTEFGGEELRKYIGKEVEGFLVIRDEG